MKKRRHTLAIALALAFTLAACTTNSNIAGPTLTGATTNPAAQRARLDTLLTTLDAEKAISWRRYQGALADNKTALSDIASICAAPQGVTNNELLASCYATSAQAYGLLADLPYASDSTSPNPVIALGEVHQSAAAACGTLEGSAACDTVDLNVTTALARATSAAIKAAELGSAPIDADKVAGHFNILTGEIDTGWNDLLAPRGDDPRGLDARKARYGMATAIACNALQSAPVLQGRASAGEPAMKISAASSAMARAAALSLRPNLCEGSETSCTVNTQCQVETPDATCTARFTLALKTACGAG